MVGISGAVVVLVVVVAGAALGSVKCRYEGEEVVSTFRACSRVPPAITTLAR